MVTKIVEYRIAPEARSEVEAAEAAHRTAPHTVAFVDVLYPRCEAPPRFTTLLEITEEGG